MRDLVVGETYTTEELGEMFGMEITEESRIVVPGIGIPYGKVVSYDDGSERGLQWFALCPSCDSLVLLTEMKDEESFTKREYMEHWESAHGNVGSERDPVPDRDERV